PSTAVVGGPGFTLFVKGSNFKPSATVLFDEMALVTTFKSATDLLAQAPAPVISRIGVHTVSVRTPKEPASNEAVFQVFPDAPFIASLDPASVIEGSGDVTVTITGEKFQPGAMVRLIDLTQRGAPLDTTFESSERLRAKIPAALTQTPGAVALGVENPDL